MEQLKAIIESAFERRADITPRNADTGLREAVNSALALLDGGEARVAEKKNGQWVVNEWLKKAVLLSFRINDNAVIRGGDTNYYDKVPMKYADYNSRDFQESGVRVVPPAAVRKGAYIAPNVVLMPSYVIIGAYVDEGTMGDTWATVGSCAQVGKNVHLSGGVGLGGVLEPVQAAPVIIEDGAFIGSRCIVVEGIRVGKEAVLGANVVLTASTRIIDVTKEKAEEWKGFVPDRAVVIPGTYQKSFPSGNYGVPCALIIGERKPSTDLKTSLNDALRSFDVPV